MKLPVNGARGEVGITIGDTEIVIAATMEGLANVSTELKCKSLLDLYERLGQVEVAATIAGIRHLTVRGNKEAALAKLKIRHFTSLAEAFNSALAHHHDGEPGKEALREAQL